MKAITFKVPTVYDGKAYDAGETAMVDDNYADYTVGMGNAELAKKDAKPTEKQAPFQPAPHAVPLGGQAKAEPNKADLHKPEPSKHDNDKKHGK